ncbi:hypothetical protein RCL1_007545 [Eukaryota sp. TZLM3-RCL]
MFSSEVNEQLNIISTSISKLSANISSEYERRARKQALRELTEKFFLEAYLFLSTETMDNIYVVNRKTVKFLSPTKGVSLTLSEDECRVSIQATNNGRFCC